jgi:hypothetical protein
MLYVYDIPYYFTYSLTIGCKTYEGISCDHADFAWNVTTTMATMTYHPTWYIGKLGCLYSGFRGTAHMTLFGYWNDGAGNEGWDHYVMAFDLHGFGYFRGQGLWLAGDSRVNAEAGTGNIFAWGHRC